MFCVRVRNKRKCMREAAMMMILSISDKGVCSCVCVLQISTVLQVAMVMCTLLQSLPSLRHATGTTEVNIRGFNADAWPMQVDLPHLLHHNGGHVGGLEPTSSRRCADPNTDGYCRGCLITFPSAAALLDRQALSRAPDSPMGSIRSRSCVAVFEA